MSIAATSRPPREPPSSFTGPSDRVAIADHAAPLSGAGRAPGWASSSWQVPREIEKIAEAA